LSPTDRYFDALHSHLPPAARSAGTQGREHHRHSDGRRGPLVRLVASSTHARRYSC